MVSEVSNVLICTNGFLYSDIPWKNVRYVLDRNFPYFAKYNIADLHYALGNFKEAKQYMEEAVALDPQFAEDEYVNIILNIEEAQSRGTRAKDSQSDQESF